jgi:hypothetical protein
MDGSLGNHVQFKTIDDVSKQLLALGNTVETFAEWTCKHCERNEENIVLYNLLTAFLPYLKLIQMHVAGPVPLLAFCTRTAYELNVQTRRVLKSSEDLKEWIGEAGGDRIEFLEALLKLQSVKNLGTKRLEEEVQRIRASSLLM